MARGQIPIQELAANGGVDQDIDFSAGDAGNDHYFLNTGREILFMKSTNGSLSSTVISVTDSNGRTGDKTLTPAAGKIAAAGPFRPDLFTQVATGWVHVDLTDATNVSFAVVRFNFAA